MGTINAAFIGAGTRGPSALRAIELGQPADRLSRDAPPSIKKDDEARDMVGAFIAEA